MNDIGLMMACRIKKEAICFIQEMRRQGVSETDIAVMAKYMPFFLNGVNENLFGVNLNVIDDEFKSKI